MALIDKASLLMVPSTYEAGKLYNDLPSGNRAPDSTDQNSGYDQTRADFDFDRGSNTAATRIGSDGLIKKYRENLFTNSNMFTGISLDGITRTTAQADPFGGSNAIKITENTSASNHRWYKLSATPVGVYTASFYAKYDSRKYVRVFTANANATIDYNLIDGTIDYSASEIDATMVSVGDGWYRCSVSVSGTASNWIGIYLLNDSRSNNYTGDGTSSALLYGFQVESGLVSTDYLDSTSVTGKAGVLVDLPRINYDANGENGALLLEPQRKNVVTSTEYVSSNDYVVGNWTGTITTNTTETLSPEGVYNATKFVKAGASDRVYFHNSQPDGAYTGSIYLKAASGSENKTIEISIRRFGGGGGSRTKLVTITNEWQRFDVSASNLTGGTTTAMYISDFSSAGTATDFYSYGMQIEAGSYATSYIPNHGESGGVTRAADSCSVTGASDVIGQTEGTLFVEVDAETIGKMGSNGTQRIIMVSDGTNTNRTIINFFQNSSNVTQVEANLIKGSSQASFANTINENKRYKLAFAYKANDFTFYVNGVQIGSDTSGATYTAGTLTRLDLGQDRTGTLQQANPIKQAVLFNERLTNAELATLTTL
jgi:hypothetical protein